MKQIAPVLLAAGLAATWTGCQSATDPTGAPSPADATQTAALDHVLVTLKVPNMT